MSALNRGHTGHTSLLQQGRSEQSVLSKVFTVQCTPVQCTPGPLHHCTAQHSLVLPGGDPRLPADGFCGSREGLYSAVQLYSRVQFSALQPYSAVQLQCSPVYCFEEQQHPLAPLPSLPSLPWGWGSSLVF